MKCIYCLRSEGEGATFVGVEHVIPQAFGAFGSKTPTLDCVCDDCNKYFGRELDMYLARETIEGVLRYSRGIFSSEDRPQKKLEISIADGALTGVRVVINGTNAQLIPPRAQFHAFNFHSKANEVYFSHQIDGLSLPEAIYGHPGRNGAKETWRVNVFAPSQEELDAIVGALQANGIEYRRPSLLLPLIRENEGENPPTVRVLVEGEVDITHKRALAKILMNFIAYYLGCGAALQPSWDFLRRYVRFAEGLIKAKITEHPFWDGVETETLRFPDDSIDIRIENLNDKVVGSIRFYSRHTYQFILAENYVLSEEAEVGCRFTPGEVPIIGEKRGLLEPR